VLSLAAGPNPEPIRPTVEPIGRSTVDGLHLSAVGGRACPFVTGRYHAQGRLHSKIMGGGRFHRTHAARFTYEQLKGGVQQASTARPWQRMADRWR
jgi:hypothetical protein